MGFKRLMAVVISLSFGLMADGQSAYVKKYRPLADSISNVYQIPAKVILAIAIIESSSGTSRNARLLNNHFGIVGKNNLMKTRGIKTAYKQYASAHDSYLDFARMISRKKYYTAMKGNPSSEKWIDVISRHGYSVKPAAWRAVMLNTLRKIK